MTTVLITQCLQSDFGHPRPARPIRCPACCPPATAKPPASPGPSPSPTAGCGWLAGSGPTGRDRR